MKRLQDTKLPVFKYADENNLTTEALQTFINNHKNLVLPILQENEDFILQRNLEIDTEFLEEENAGTFAGIRNKNNIANVICNTHFSYSFGQDIQYVSNEDEKDSLEEYLLIETENNGQDKTKKLGDYMGKFGMAFELVYLNQKGQIVYNAVSPAEAFLIHDYSLDINPIFGVRYYKDYDKKTIVEVYGKYTYKKYITSDTGVFNLVEEKQNLYNIVNLIMYKNNDYTLSDFQPVKTYLQDIDKTNTTRSNSLHYINDAILLLTNVEAELEDLADMKSKRVIMVNSGGDVASEIDWLEKPINTEAFESHLKQLYKNAFNESFTPFISNEEFANAPSGKALEIMYLSASTIATQKQVNMAQSLKQRINIIFNILNFNKLDNFYTFNSIKPIFSKNLPTITSVELEDLQKLVNIVNLSKKTKLELIPNKFITNVEEELARQEEEGLESIDFSKEV